MDHADSRMVGIEGGVEVDLLSPLDQHVAPHIAGLSDHAIPKRSYQGVLPALLLPGYKHSRTPRCSALKLISSDLVSEEILSFIYFSYLQQRSIIFYLQPTIGTPSDLESF